jgi:hypothetical protein
MLLLSSKSRVNTEGVALNPPHWFVFVPSGTSDTSSMAITALELSLTDLNIIPWKTFEGNREFDDCTLICKPLSAQNNGMEMP